MENFLRVYKQLDADNLDLLADIYDNEIIFCDPAHKIEGLTQLRTYFWNLYKNLEQIDFDFHHPVKMDDTGYVQWTMTFSHPAVNKGQNIRVEGATFVQFNNEGKVIYHRDHFDLGSMIYQHIPVLGRIIKTINRRLGS